MPELIPQKRNGNWKVPKNPDRSTRLCDICGEPLPAGYARHLPCRDIHEAQLREKGVLRWTKR